MKPHKVPSEDCHVLGSVGSVFILSPSSPFLLSWSGHPVISRPQIPTWWSRRSVVHSGHSGYSFKNARGLPLSLPRPCGSITVWQAQPGLEDLWICALPFFGLVSRLFPSPGSCDIVMLNTRPALLTQPSASYSLGLERLLPLL